MKVKPAEVLEKGFPSKIATRPFGGRSCVSCRRNVALSLGKGPSPQPCHPSDSGTGELASCRPLTQAK